MQCKHAGTRAGRDCTASIQDIEHHLVQLRACFDRWYSCCEYVSESCPDCTVNFSIAMVVRVFTSVSHPIEIFTKFSTSLLSCSVSALLQGPAPHNNITAVTPASVCLGGGFALQHIHNKPLLELSAYFPNIQTGLFCSCLQSQCP